MEPHDLLRVTRIRPAQAPPAWVGRSLALAPWVVVRRAPARDRLIPVGVRGVRRGQRFACHVDATSVVERLSPEQLRARSGDLPPAAPARRALTSVEHILYAHLATAAWGPVGSVGFQLATGLPTIRDDSDLDVVLYRDQPLPRRAARILSAAFEGLSCRIDCQLATPRGGVSLADWAGTAAEVLLKTQDGPVLTRDPWSPP